MSNRRQPQRLPPPIMHGLEAIDAEEILKEFPEERALPLWKTVRSVRLWAELPEAERKNAFLDEAYDRRIDLLERADFPAEVKGALVRAAAVLQPRARAATVAAACQSIVAWAVEEGALGTAIEFQQAAAVALPAEAEPAFQVARLARTRTEYARAETWYRHAISRARKARSWFEFSRAYIGMGTVFVLRGNYPQAKRALIRGLRAAKRFSIRSLAAAAYHELAVLGMHRDNPVEVNRYTRAALETYGREHPRLPALAFDYAVFLLSAGYFAEALRTFRAIPADFGSPVDRLVRAAAIVRAAGGVGDRRAFDQAWRNAERLRTDPAAASAVATALISMARGAESLGELDRAEKTAIEAQRLAAERGEAEIEFSASAVLESIRSGAATATPPAPQPAPPRTLGIVRRFETAMVAAEPI